MKRIVAASILFLLIVFGCVTEYRAVSNAAESLSASVSGQTDSRVLYESYTQWQSKKPLLCSMIAHNEIDQIETLYLRAIQAAKNQDLDETRLQVAELTGMLMHLSETQFPHLYNVF